MKQILRSAMCVFVLVAPVLAQSTATITATHLTDNQGNPLLTGKFCFGAQCLAVINGVITGTTPVNQGTQAVTITNKINTITYMIVPNVTIATPTFSWDSYVVSAGQEVLGVGIPTLACTSLATFRDLYSNQRQTCLGSPGAWVPNTSIKGSGTYAANGPPTFPCIAPCNYSQQDASPASAAQWQIIAPVNTPSINWVQQGSTGGATTPATNALYKGTGTANGIIPATPNVDYVTPTGSITGTASNITGVLPLSQTSGTLAHSQLPPLVAADIPDNAANTTGSASNITGVLPLSQTSGTLAHAQLPALVAGDIPNNAANTTGTATNITGTLPLSQTSGTLPHAQLPTLLPGDLPVGSASQFGAVKVDGTTIVSTGGVISSTSSGGASAPATSSLYKGNGTANGIIPAVANTDYLPAANPVTTGISSHQNLTESMQPRINVMDPAFGATALDFTGNAAYTAGTALVTFRSTPVSVPQAGQLLVFYNATTQGSAINSTGCAQNGTTASFVTASQSFRNAETLYAMGFTGLCARYNSATTALYTIANSGLSTTQFNATTSQATGYLSTATSAITSGAVTSVTVTAGSASYTACTAVAGAAPAGGTTATLGCSVSGGVPSISVTTGGSGYTSAPAILLFATDSGTFAQTADLKGKVASATTSGVTGVVDSATGGSTTMTPTITVAQSTAAWATDDTAYLQAGLSAGNTVVHGAIGSRYPMVFLPQGEFAITAPLTSTGACHVEGVGGNAGTQVVWWGGNTSSTSADVSCSNTQSSLLANMQFAVASNNFAPAYVFSGSNFIDSEVHFHDVKTNNAARLAVYYFNGDVNLHWDHMTSRGIIGDFIKEVIPGGYNRDSFDLTDWTIDTGSTFATAQGGCMNAIYEMDMTSATGWPGPRKFANFRAESQVGTNWCTPAGVASAFLITAGASPVQYGQYILDNATFNWLGTTPIAAIASTDTTGTPTITPVFRNLNYGQNFAYGYYSPAGTWAGGKPITQPSEIADGLYDIPSWNPNPGGTINTVTPMGPQPLNLVADSEITNPATNWTLQSGWATSNTNCGWLGGNCFQLTGTGAAFNANTVSQVISQPVTAGQTYYFGGAIDCSVATSGTAKWYAVSGSTTVTAPCVSGSKGVYGNFITIPTGATTVSILANANSMVVPSGTLFSISKPQFMLTSSRALYTPSVTPATTAAGGTSGQTQYNNGGVLGGYTPSGDCTVTPSTGATICTKTNGTLFGTAATQNTGTSGATIPLQSTSNTWAGTQNYNGGVNYAAATNYVALGTATSGGNFSSNKWSLLGSFWNGSAAAASSSQAQLVMGTDLTGAATQTFQMSMGGSSTGLRKYAFDAGAYAPQFVNSSSTPTIAVGAAAGTSPGTPTVTGNNGAGVVTVITGTATTSNAILATVTFNGTLGAAPQSCNLMARGSNAASVATTVFTAAPTTTTWTLNSGATALTASTTYVWSYICQ